MTQALFSNCKTIALFGSHVQSALTVTKSPFFTIVIPVYNRETLIQRTVASLLAQEFTDFEIIVVNDGSTDDTEKAILDISDGRLQYFKKENGERGAARNFGAARAQGAYVNFFDSDDEAYPNHLSAARRIADRKNHPEVFHLGYEVKDSNGKLESRVEHFGSTINRELINGNHLSCNGVFVRRDIALKNPFNEDRILSGSEDYELWLRLASRYSFYCDNTVTTVIINHDARSVLNTNEDKLVKRVEALQFHLVNDVPFIRYYKQELPVFQAYLDIYIALHIAMSGRNKGKSLKYLLRAVRLSPQVSFTRRFLAVLKKVFF